MVEPLQAPANIVAPPSLKVTAPRGLSPVRVAVKVTVTPAAAGLALEVTTTEVGLRGVTLADAVDAGPVPALLVAVTVQVTATPFASPVTRMGDPAPPLTWPPQVAA